MIVDDLKLTGRLTVDLVAEDGTIKDTQEIPNLVVTTGKTFVASRMAGTASGVMSHMAIGTSNTAAVVGDTSLASEVARVALTTTMLSMWLPSQQTRLRRHQALLRLQSLTTAQRAPCFAERFSES